MSEIKVLGQADKFVHATVGSLSDLAGKVFVKEAIGSTSCEISFGTLPTGAAVPFFHSHKENEEHYLILSGEGRFQVDDKVFEIGEGSIVRVMTNCDRNLKCTSATPLKYICIQAKEGSLGRSLFDDVELNERENLL